MAAARWWSATLVHTAQHRRQNFVAEFISPQKCTRLVFIVGNIIPKSVKCIRSSTKRTAMASPIDPQTLNNEALMPEALNHETAWATIMPRRRRAQEPPSLLKTPACHVVINGLARLHYSGMSQGLQATGLGQLGSLKIPQMSGTVCHDFRVEPCAILYVSLPVTAFMFTPTIAYRWFHIC